MKAIALAALATLLAGGLSFGQVAGAAGPTPVVAERTNPPVIPPHIPAVTNWPFTNLPPITNFARTNLPPMTNPPPLHPPGNQ